MRKAALPLAGVVLSLASLTIAATPAIQPDAVLAHIRFLASDDLQGRANGSEGLQKAGDYIAQQFKSAGLRPGGKDGGWFQPFELVAGLEIGEGNEVVIQSRGARAVQLTLGSSFMPLSVTPNDSTTAPSEDLRKLPLVFAGYGISSTPLGYDDYADLDVSGKAVLIFSHEPQENDRDSRFNGTRPIRETTLYAKAMAARTRGARVLIVVSDPAHQTDPVDYGQFKIEQDSEDHSIPVLRVSRTGMAPLLRQWGLDNIAAQIDRDLRPRSRALADTTLDYMEHLSKKRRIVRNVVGVLTGSDSLKEPQAIVVGAHYDHVGLGGRFSAAPDRTGEIHNGADDNASGTASVIEIARAAAADRARFPRSLVFVTFAGEERGLLGSAFYANNPVIPIGDTVAMLNLDMVGRANGKVNVSGLDMAPSLERDMDAAGKGVGIDVRHEGPGAGRSDDSSFLDRRIPAINFFTGFHNDYHRPTDDWDKIDAAGTARVATLALEFAARIAARNDRPEFKP